LKIISNITELRAELGLQKNIAFVPTMGNLHDGHLALVRKAKQLADCVVVSIFVNPLQFRPNEDYDQYPRTPVADCERLKTLDVDIVFTPDDKILFPVEQQILVLLPPIADQFEGAYRPGFFRGVATIVLKLFNIVQPNIALFGKKDYQQLHIVRLLVQQLNLPIHILDVETERASDGLALSSRNQYLNASQRTEANQLFQTLCTLKKHITAGQTDYPMLEKEAKDSLKKRGWSVDYIAILNQASLTSAESEEKKLVVVAAARLGQTRLIDNIEINQE